VSVLASLLNLLNFDWFSSPLALVVSLFSLWMLIDALRRREWIWAVFIFVGFGFAALWYYFYVYRQAPSATRGFELPGSHSRRRIKELQAQIHHLDKAHHHYQLGDVYFQQGKLEKAEECYRASLERDPLDIDTRAHLGQCLLRKKQPADALPLYPRAKVQLAELYMARNQPDLARSEVQEVLADDLHAPAFQRRRDRVWVHRAKRLMRRFV
jgi:tetratricopeptide (TPR) repeat protein